MSFPGGPVVKDVPTSARDVGSVPGSGGSLGEGNGNPLQYSCLQNSMDKRSLLGYIHGVTRVGHNRATLSYL